MKNAIALARARESRTDELAAAATDARERYDLYKARAHGPRMTSPAKIRELEHAIELADTRLMRAQQAPDPNAPEDLASAE